MKSLVLVVALCAVTAIAACTSPQDPDADRREVRGDTVLVHSASAGVRGALHLEDDLTIGVLEGDLEYMFGSIFQFQVDDAGGVYVFDTGGPSLRYYDANGNYVRTLGGTGIGPGEYQDVLLGLRIRSDGRVVTSDPRNRRLTVYNPDGSFSEQWDFQSGLFTSRPSMFVDDRDHLFLYVLRGRPVPGKPWRHGLLHLDDRGVEVDTLALPTIPGKPEEIGGQFRPAQLWSFGPSGEFVIGYPDTYAFEIRHRDGRVIRVEREWEPVAVATGERAELEARNEWMRTYRSQGRTTEIPPIPSTKAAYGSLTLDDDGRVWVRVFSPAQKDESVMPVAVDENTSPSVSWIEPTVYDLFSPEGDYVGRVTMPERTSFGQARGEFVWGTRRGEAGEESLVRMRLVDGEAGDA